jgi:hypothetical protein
MWYQLVLPAPRGIRTSGSDAEAAAGDAVLSLPFDLRASLIDFAKELRRKYAGTGADPDAVRLLIRDAKRLSDGISGFEADVWNKHIALRTYATTGTVYKSKFGFRCSNAGNAVHPDPTALRTIREFPFPKFIWVVELMDRRVRDLRSGQPPVVGEIIVDASVTPTDPDVLLIHLPGVFVYGHPRQFQASEWLTGNTSGRIQQEVDAPIEGDFRVPLLVVDARMRYHTGRTSLKYDKGPSVHGQGKGAVSGTSFQFG